jgi:hypothetical protein
LALDSPEVVNDRKHLPPKDVAEAGGWSNVETMLQVYTQTDSETRLSVVLNGRDWAQSTGHSQEADSQEAA